MPPLSDVGPALPADARSLLDAVVAISSDLDLHSVLERIVVSACRMTGARYGALGVLGNSGDLVDFVTSGLTPEQHAAIGELPRGKGILGLLIQEPRPLRLRTLQAHPASFGFPPGHPPMETFLGVPVRIRGTVFGNLYLTEKVGDTVFTEEDEQLVDALARAAGFVIDNARSFARSERRRQWLEASAEIVESLQPPVELDAALAGSCSARSGSPGRWPSRWCSGVRTGTPWRPRRGPRRASSTSWSTRWPSTSTGPRPTVTRSSYRGESRARPCWCRCVRTWSTRGC